MSFESKIISLVCSLKIICFDQMNLGLWWMVFHDLKIFSFSSKNHWTKSLYRCSKHQNICHFFEIIFTTYQTSLTLFDWNCFSWIRLNFSWKCTYHTFLKRILCMIFSFVCSQNLPKKFPLNFHQMLKFWSLAQRVLLWFRLWYLDFWQTIYRFWGMDLSCKWMDF